LTIVIGGYNVDRAINYSILDDFSWVVQSRVGNIVLIINELLLDVSMVYEM